MTLSQINALVATFVDDCGHDVFRQTWPELPFFDTQARPFPCGQIAASIGEIGASLDLDAILTAVKDTMQSAVLAFKERLVPATTGDINDWFFMTVNHGLFLPTSFHGDFIVATDRGLRCGVTLQGYLGRRFY